jgi:hypothetical protein
MLAREDRPQPFQRWTDHHDRYPGSDMARRYGRVDISNERSHLEPEGLHVPGIKTLETLTCCHDKLAAKPYGSRSI